MTVILISTASMSGSRMRLWTSLLALMADSPARSHHALLHGALSGAHENTPRRYSAQPGCAGCQGAHIPQPPDRAALGAGEPAGVPRRQPRRPGRRPRWVVRRQAPADRHRHGARTARRARSCTPREAAAFALLAGIAPAQLREIRVKCNTVPLIAVGGGLTFQERTTRALSRQGSIRCLMLGVPSRV